MPKRGEGKGEVWKRLRTKEVSFELKVSPNHSTGCDSGSQIYVKAVISPELGASGR